MTAAASMPIEAPSPDLRSLVLKLGDLTLDQHQMGRLAENNIGDPLIVNPLVRFMQQINDDIFRVYEQLFELTNTEKESVQVVTKQPVAPSENVGLSSDDVIRMDEQRSRRFLNELFRLSDEVKSLAASSKCFPNLMIEDGQISPAAAVELFSTSMQKRLFLLIAMANYEEQGMPELREVEQ